MGLSLMYLLFLLKFSKRRWKVIFRKGEHTCKMLPSVHGWVDRRMEHSGPSIVSYSWFVY